MEVGDIKINKEGQAVEILEINKKANRMLVEFLDSYNIKEVSISSWRLGILRDGFFPSVGGVGYNGNARKSDHLIEYSVWKNIIYRCYVENSDDYRFYGKEGVTVCDKWKCFEYFLEDLPHIEGYELFEKTKTDRKLSVHLDKDFKQMDVPLNERVYSLETCMFMLADDNRKMVKRKEFLPHKTKTMVVGLNPDGEQFCIINIPMFAKEHNLRKTNIYQVISGEKKSHKGWNFKRVENHNNDVITITKDEFKRGYSKSASVKVKVKNISSEEEYIFDSILDASNYINIHKDTLARKTKDGSSIINGFIVERV